MRKTILFLIPFLLFSCTKKTDSVPKSDAYSNSYSSMEEEESSLSISSVGFSMENGLPNLSIHGHFGKDIFFDTPILEISINQDGKMETIRSKVETDGTDFHSLVPLSRMNYADTWYNITLILDQEKPTSKIPVNINSLPASTLSDTLTWKQSDFIRRVYFFEQYNNNLKVLFKRQDQKKTTFSSMCYEIVKSEFRQELYFHLRGYNEHDDLRLRLSGKIVRESEIAPLGEFDFYVKVDDILKKKSDPYAISVQYRLSDGSLVTESISSKNLANHTDLEGVSFKGDIYVFLGEKIGKETYYSLSFNSDTFSMDTVILYRENGVSLYFSGSSHYYPEGNYYLHIEEGMKGEDAVIQIPRNCISLTGYIRFNTGLEQIIFTEEEENENTGRLSIYHDNILLNYFWPNSWSHRQDKTEKIDEDGYEYEICYNSQNNYCLRKERSNRK